MGPKDFEQTVDDWTALAKAAATDDPSAVHR